MAVKEKIRIRLQSYDVQLIDAAAEKITSGELHVFAGPLTGVTPDGEEYTVAEGDYYHEQEESSAPSWNYIVEGCNVVE